jgi:hypothetical protein
MTTDDLRNATEIYDGERWFYGIEPGSIELDHDHQFVTFTVRWGRQRQRRRITLAVEQVRGTIQPG